MLHCNGVQVACLAPMLTRTDEPVVQDIGELVPRHNIPVEHTQANPDNRLQFCLVCGIIIKIQFDTDTFRTTAVQQVARSSSAVGPGWCSAHRGTDPSHNQSHVLDSTILNAFSSSNRSCSSAVEHKIAIVLIIPSWGPVFEPRQLLIFVYFVAVWSTIEATDAGIAVPSLSI